ncbi:phage tail sheath family protein [Streptosporangium roseum]|uniref:phage tail sheath family protein n=1 Tax=Streptosporangium roseum TaxID=2001 RepID=UPI003316B1E3
MAFVGFAAAGPFHLPTWLHSWAQFQQNFGDFAEGFALAHAVYGFFANGGQACVVVRVGHDSEDLRDTFVGDADHRTGVAALQTLEDVSIICAPDLMTSYERRRMDLDAVRAAQVALIAHCEFSGDRMVILDCPPGLSPQQVRDWRIELTAYDSAQAALYYPWIKVYDPSTGMSRSVPPCGHVAGVYARVDLLRGFHHTPANQSLEGARSVELIVSHSEQEVLNPIGVNTLVMSPGRGVVVWGSRTLSSNPDWRYIHRRRVVNFILRNIRRGTEWAIFERPDDLSLRPRIAADIRDFLHLLWRSGALWGDTPEDAFWVSYDSGPFGDDRSVYIDCTIELEDDFTSSFRLLYFCD